jgi:fumarylacetoacetate (FAA) hydrolase
VETLRDGKPATPFMKFGDSLKIDVTNAQGASIFGSIEQKIEPYRS